MTNTSSPVVPAAARSDLVPTGTLRAGINLSNTLLSTRDPASGEVRGVAVDFAQELGRRLAVPVEIVTYGSPGEMSDAVTSGLWDVAFLAAEPARAVTIAFTAAYAEIEATYLVPGDSSIQDIADVDREGMRVAVAARSAYDLYLTRNVLRARLIRAEGQEGTLKMFVDERLDALSGLRPMLTGFAARLPGSRVLVGRFTAIQQAIGMPAGREAGAAYLCAFVEDVKRSGLVAELIARHHVRGLWPAPLAASR